MGITPSDVIQRLGWTCDAMRTPPLQML